MKHWAVDKIDGDWTVLEGEVERVTVPTSWLPERVVEGMVLRLRIDSGDDRQDSGSTRRLSFTIDDDEAERRRDAAEKRLESLPRGPSGDVQL